MAEAVKGAREVLRGTTVTQQQIDDSVQSDKIQCLEDGTWHVMLRRYIKRRFNLTPQQYRDKWGLPDDYPFVAPAYAKKRSKIAKKSGLGKR
ncbi:MAG: MucR family transcriptional regulator [Alphaproteobacteria bacterium]|nr:MucR family transcriptional regulator [Alphaproteobacteria bacterium]MBR6684764.1 MucR family transcriptional regulator [Alphaproteobacteria bacterium]